MAGDFEEKYLLLRDENTALKKKKNEQEATIKRMYTKLAIIEEAMKKKRLSEEQDNQEEGDTVGTTARDSVVPSRRDLDTEKFIQALKSENMQLRKKNQALMEKNRGLEEKIRQHQLKYHANPKTQSASVTNASLGPKKPTIRTSAAGAKKKASVGIENESLEKQVDQARRIHREHLSGDLEMALKNRLVVAEKQLIKLQHENEQLRLQTQDRGRARLRRASRDNNNTLSDGEASDREQRAFTDLDADHLRRELRDRQAQISILKARYENLEANFAAEREIQEQTIEQLEVMNRQVHKLRSQLQDTSLEKDEIEVRLSKAADLEREITILRDQNRKLEERMTSMCESPFINDAFQRKERIDKMFDLEKQTQQQQAVISQMTEENQRLHVAIKELQSNVKLMKQAKEMVEQDMDKLRQLLVDERNARSLAAVSAFPIMTQSPKPPSPQPRHPSPVTSAITIQPDRRDAASSPLKGEQPASFSNNPPVIPIVTRRYPDASLFSAAAGSSDLDGSGGNNVKHLKNRIHVLQLAHLKAVQELERCEKMLHAQTNINKELAQEIEELTTKNVSSSENLQKRLKQLELSVDEKQQRIQLLEAQNRQLKYARERLVKAQEADKKLSELDISSDEEDDTAEVTSLSESLVMAARDLAPGEQLLEIWIVSANFDRTFISSNASTFVLCDFYDFESQSTPLLVGHRPEYNFASTYKVTVDGFFLRYLASETIFFELHQAIQGDFRLVGRAGISLSPLLRSKGVIKEPELPVKLAFGSEHDSLIGTLNVALRFAAPISEVWKLHLRSYPQDIQLLSKKNILFDPVEDFLLEDGYEDSQLKGVNELQITVFACRGLRSYGKKKATSGDPLSMTPSAYVHYQILGFPDMFTNIVPSSSSPEFDLHISKQYFALEVDACLLQFFSKFELWFTVFDDKVDVGSDNSDGTIGRCGIRLEEIIKGESVRGWFQLRDKNDQSAGEISVLIEWKDPFQVAQLYSSTRRVGTSAKVVDLHCIDYDQQHAIMRLFAPDMDGRINYRQFLNYALPSEALELVTSKIRERLEYAIDTEQLTCVQDVFLPNRLDQSGKIRNDVLKDISTGEMQKRLERFGVFLKDEEYELLKQHFERRSQPNKEVDTPKLQVHYLLNHINPRYSCAERLLLHKIRHTLRIFQRTEKGLNAPSPSPSEPFERYDPSQSGFVSRAEFKRCLGVLGFELLDIDKAYKEFIEKEVHTQHKPTDLASKMLTNQSDGADLDDLVLKNRESLCDRTDEHDNTVEADETATGKATRSVGLKTKTPKTSEARPIDARTEFDRRKELFLERIKAIASSSAKSSVYEQLEKQRVDRRAQQEQLDTSNPISNIISSASILDRVRQEISQMHIPKALHHDAARILQRQFRQYRARQSTAVTSSSHTVHIPFSEITEIDGHLSRILKTWTRDELESLEATMIKTIESELPEARKDRIVSRKQLGFVLSKIPRIAFEPDLISRLASHFTVGSRADLRGIAYAPLVHFVCTTMTEPKRGECQTISVMKALSQVYIDSRHAMDTFRLVGDVKGTGKMRISRFHESLSRVGIQLTSRDRRVLTVLLSDSQGVEIFYFPVIKLLRDSPVAIRMRDVVARCNRYGVDKLHKNLVAQIDTDDGVITREHLHNVLMQENAEVTRFMPSDSYVLMELTKLSCSRITVEDKVSIGDLVQTLERMRESTPISDDELGSYTISQLQRIARSSRTMLCPSYPQMADEFERYDWKETGLVTLSEFVAVIPHIGFTLFTSKHIDQIAKHFGAKLKGSFGINYRQFLDWATPVATTPDIEVIEAKLRRYVLEKSSDAQKISQVLAAWRDAFGTADKLSSGFIRRGEFAKICIETLALPLEPEELRALLFSYDRSMDDNVDYGAFVQLNWRETSQQSGNQQRKQVQFAPQLSEVLCKLRKTLTTDKILVDDFIESLKTASSGDTVDITQFIVSMKQLGATITPEEAEVIFRAHAEPSEGATQPRLHLLNFFESTLSIPSRESVKNTKRPKSAQGVADNTRIMGHNGREESLGAITHKSQHPLQSWFLKFSEALRARIRGRAGLAGPISNDQSIQQLCGSLNAAFSHFDREKNGFLTHQEILAGLRALKYDLSNDQAVYFARLAGVFRHNEGSGGLSRMEFDSFVLDPGASALLRQIAALLYKPCVDEPAIPGVARLSRLFMMKDQPNHLGVLPVSTACTTLEEVMGRSLPMEDQRRLQILFDVNRDGMFAYKLFLKVMSQWQTSSSIEPLDHSGGTSATLSPSNETRRASTTNNFHATLSDVLRSLYNQLSSIDFDSQIDIFAEHLHRLDKKRGGVKAEDFENVISRIGLKLSTDGVRCLLESYGSKKEKEIDHRAILKAIKRIHKEEEQ